MDYARREFLLTFRRVLGGFLALTLLIAFWSDRPLAAASQPKPTTGSILRGETEIPAHDEPRPTAVISLFRRPWLMFYTLMGAPALDHGALTEAEETRFRWVVSGLALGFFGLATALWWRGQYLIDTARAAE